MSDNKKEENVTERMARLCQSLSDTTKADIIAQVKDPANKFVFELHAPADGTVPDDSLLLAYMEAAAQSIKCLCKKAAEKIVTTSIGKFDQVVEDHRLHLEFVAGPLRSSLSVRVAPCNGNCCQLTEAAAKVIVA